MKNHRKKAVAILAGLAVTGIVGASAASLGTISNQSLGAATEVVASCDADGVTASYTTSLDPLTNKIVVDTVTISDVATPSCNGLAYEVVLTGGAGLPRVILGEASGNVPAAPATAFTASGFTVGGVATPVDAALVTGIAITISG